ncbi:unnamed protein product, partial [Allacma fusca]
SSNYDQCSGSVGKSRLDSRAQVRFSGLEIENFNTEVTKSNTTICYMKISSSCQSFVVYLPVMNISEAIFQSTRMVRPGQDHICDILFRNFFSGIAGLIEKISSCFLLSL